MVFVYTYQSEISQGRLKCISFSRNYKKYNWFRYDNHGLLDHSHSLIEAIRLIIKYNSTSKIDFNNSNNCFINKNIFIDSNIFNHLKSIKYL